MHGSVDADAADVGDWVGSVGGEDGLVSPTMVMTDRGAVEVEEREREETRKRKRVVSGESLPPLR